MVTSQIIFFYIFTDFWAIFEQENLYLKMKINGKVGNVFLLPTKVTTKPDKLKQKLFNAIQICTNENKGHHHKIIELELKKNPKPLEENIGRDRYPNTK